MLFSSYAFLFFFLTFVLFFYYILFRKNRSLQNIFLLLASLFFYAWGEPYFVLIMIGSIIINWLFGIIIHNNSKDKKKGKIVLICSLVFNIGLIFYYKYLMFTLENISFLFNTNFQIPSITLPIGISFFTFQSMSYVIDTYAGKCMVQKNPLYLGLYISFFPQLIAGPIVRYTTIADQIHNRQESFMVFSEGVCRFILGLGKKVLIANSMAVIADKAFSMLPGELSFSFAWLGAIAYTFQIFFDFAGYSDMAIGLGRMFGFHFLENFNYPYIAKSITEFWRRWHISLGTWFRDYVYIPLGGSRVESKSRLVFNLFIVWTLTGLWHGANWTFIVWGLMYFVLIGFEKLTDFNKKASKKVLLRHCYTLFFVIIGWVIFRATDMMHAINYLKVLFFANGKFSFDSNTLLFLSEYKFFFLAAILFSVPVAKRIPNRIKRSKLVSICCPIAYITIFVVSVSYIAKSAYNPFIYFNF